MGTIEIEFLGEVPLYLGMGIEIVTALFLGGLVGIDREKKMKSAGIKTNILICIGATLYTAISELNMVDAIGPADPNRMAAQIVSGIGFLGAGAIIQGRGGVVGMTTAATIWVVAAIGMTIGFGYPVIATLFTVTILVVLKLISPIYKLLESEKDFKHYHLEILSRGRVKHSVKQLIFNEINDINEISEELLDHETDQRILNVYITFHPRKIDNLKTEIKNILKVEKVNFHLTDYVGDDD